MYKPGCLQFWKKTMNTEPTSSYTCVKRFENTQNGAYKFWEIFLLTIMEQEDSSPYAIKYCYFTIYGRIGTKGAKGPTKKFTNESDRTEALNKIILSKLNKGYIQILNDVQDSMENFKLPIIKVVDKIIIEEQKDNTKNKSAYLSRIKNLDL